MAEENQVSRQFASPIDRKEAQRIERLALALSTKSPPWLAHYIEQLAPAFGVVGAGVEVVAPVAWKLFQTAWEIYKRLPKRAATCLYGVGICFFGGRYAVSIAAIEAFNATGGGQMIMWMEDLKEEAAKLWDASIKDDEVDADGDGTADVEQASAQDLALRKTKLFLRIADPEKISVAAGGLWAGYMGVLAALKFQFAKTVALAHSVGDAIRPPVSKVCAPLMLHLMPSDYHRWVNPAINFACKSIAMTIAWRIQYVMSTCHAGMKGGLIVSRVLFDVVRERGWMAASEDETVMDEVVGWSLAGCGIYHQLWLGGDCPFPLNVFMWPLDFLEIWLKWSVTYFASDDVKENPLK